MTNKPARVDELALHHQRPAGYNAPLLPLFLNDYREVAEPLHPVEPLVELWERDAPRVGERLQDLQEAQLQVVALQWAHPVALYAAPLALAATGRLQQRRVEERGHGRDATGQEDGFYLPLATALLLLAACLDLSGRLVLLLTLLPLLLLLALLLPLAVLGVPDGLLADSVAGLGALALLLLDHIERRTDDGALVLDGPARPLLGHLLRDALLVHAAEEDGPCDAAGVFALHEQALALALGKAEGLAVAAGKELALARVYFLPAEGIDFDAHCDCLTMEFHKMGPTQVGIR